MGFFDRRTVSVLLTILAFAGVLALVWVARLPVIAFIFALFFAQLLDPVVVRFQSWLRVSRGKAVGATYLAIFLGLLIFGFTVGPGILHQGQTLSETLPSLLENVKSGNIAWQLGGREGWSAQSQVRIQQWLMAHQNTIAGYENDVACRLEPLDAHP